MSTWRARRWAWMLGATLSVITLWRLEARRAAAIDAQRAAARNTLRGPAVTGVTWRRRPAMPRLVRPHRPGLLSVSGRVFDQDSGVPVPNVEVILADGTSEAGEHTDAAGRYEIAVPRGTYRLFVRDELVLSVASARTKRTFGRPRPEAVAASTIGLAPELTVAARVTGADLQVVRAAVVRGRVRDPSGAPLAGTIVQVEPQDLEHSVPVVGTDLAETDAAGAYRLLVPARPYQVRAFHERFGATADRPILSLAPGGTYDVDLTMTEGCMITGRVVGATISGGAVERAGGTDGSSQFVRAGELGADGRFTWSTDEERPFVLRASPVKFAPSEPQTFQCRNGVRYENVEFEIVDTDGDLMGTVVDADGAPVRDAYLDLHAVAPSTNEQIEQSDDSGAWESFSLSRGPYVVISHAPGRGLGVAHATVPARDVVVRLSGTGAIEGRTTGFVDGAFVVEAVCQTGYAAFGDDTEQFLATVTDGHFRVDGLPACRLAITARRGGAHAPTQEVEVRRGETTPIELDLTALLVKEIHGVTRDSLGRPVAGVVVRIVDARLPPLTTDADGRFVVRAPATASLLVDGAAGRLEIPDDDQPTWSVDVTVTPR